MSCTYQDDLTAYLDRELPELRARHLEAHLPGCGECRKTVELLRRTVEQLAALPAFETSPQLRRAVLNRIDEAPSGLWALWDALTRPQVAGPALAAAAVLGVVAVVGLRHHPGAPELSDPAQIEVAANMEVLEDLDVVGLDNPDDLDVVAHLDELEATP